MVAIYVDMKLFVNLQSVGKQLFTVNTFLNTD